MTERRQLLTSPQVATMLGKSIRTVQRMAEAGELPAMKLPGETGAYVYDPTEIELWQLRRQRQEAKSA
jgi:excisionase family DNA binding protein